MAAKVKANVAAVRPMRKEGCSNNACEKAPASEGGRYMTAECGAKLFRWKSRDAAPEKRKKIEEAPLKNRPSTNLSSGEALAANDDANLQPIWAIHSDLATEVSSGRSTHASEEGANRKRE